MTQCVPPVRKSQPTDENLKKTANVVKIELKSALESYRTKVHECEDVFVLIDGDLETRFTAEEKDFLDILKTVKNLFVYLEAIAIELSESKAISKPDEDEKKEIYDHQIIHGWVYLDVENEYNAVQNQYVQCKEAPAMSIDEKQNSVQEKLYSSKKADVKNAEDSLKETKNVLLAEQTKGRCQKHPEGGGPQNRGRM